MKCFPDRVYRDLGFTYHGSPAVCPYLKMLSFQGPRLAMDTAAYDTSPTHMLTVYVLGLDSGQHNAVSSLLMFLAHIW